jgi:hypothetical protein
MPLQVVYADDRQVPGIAERPGDGGADEQGADQAGSRRIGNAFNGLGRQSRLGQSASIIGRRRSMWSREASSGTTRRDAVQFDLAEDSGSREAPAALVEGDRGLVTGGLDAKDYHEARL